MRQDTLFLLFSTSINVGPVELDQVECPHVGGAIPAQAKSRHRPQFRSSLCAELMMAWASATVLADTVSYPACCKTDSANIKTCVSSSIIRTAAMIHPAWHQRSPIQWSGTCSVGTGRSGQLPDPKPATGAGAAVDDAPGAGGAGAEACEGAWGALLF